MFENGKKPGTVGSEGGPVGGGGFRSGVGGTGVCVHRIEVIVKMQKKSRGPGRGWRLLVGSKEVVGDVQYWGCEPRVEGIVNCT